MNMRVIMKRMSQLFLIVICFFVVIGCSSKDKEDLEDMDAPQEQENDLEGEEDLADGEQDLTAETVPRRLYLLSKEGVVVPHSIELPKLESNEVAAQAIEYLVEGGPISNLLPSGFEAILPVGTEVIDMNLEEDGTLVVNLTEEFNEYDGAKEQQIIQAMTYTLTEFDSVDRVSRANGINILDSDAVDLINSQAVTIYYPAQYGEKIYYVPVTRESFVPTGSF